MHRRCAKCDSRAVLGSESTDQQHQHELPRATIADRRKLRRCWQAPTKILHSVDIYKSHMAD
eukprot:scaffold111817_cov18-Prasinocladus_malaysianus.AAC.1